jgi:hypothetical protein
MNFPLYHDLLKNTTDEKLDDDEKSELIKKIKKLDEPGHELIYALIRSYQLEHENTFGHPYDSKILKLGMKFDLENIPNQCCRMLITFCDKHLEKMKEEQKLLKNRK